MSTPKRPAPLAPESQNPTCGMCGEVTEVGDQFFRCLTCACSWSISDFHLVDGEWDDDGPQCPATVRPYAGSLTHPRLAAIVERCLLTEGHDTVWHRNGRRNWTDKDRDGYLTNPIQLCASDRQGFVQDLMATVHTIADALGIPGA